MIKFSYSHKLCLTRILQGGGGQVAQSAACDGTGLLPVRTSAHYLDMSTLGACLPGWTLYRLQMPCQPAAAFAEHSRRVSRLVSKCAAYGSLSVRPCCVQVANQQGKYLASVFNGHRIHPQPDAATPNGLPPDVPRFKYRHLGASHFAYEECQPPCQKDYNKCMSFRHQSLCSHRHIPCNLERQD